jgi:iron complex transport system permease protein
MRVGIFSFDQVKIWARSWLRSPLILHLAIILGFGLLFCGQWVERPGDLKARSPAAWKLVWELRLPRFVLGCFGGGTLALAGLIFQSVFRNPLASPYTLGVSSGASLGASLVLAASGMGLSGFFGIGLSVGALMGGMVSLALIMVFFNNQEDPARLLLAGMGISLIFGGLVIAVHYLGPRELPSQILQWMVGDMAKVGWQGIAGVVVASLGLLAWAFWHHRELDLLLCDPLVARSRGLEDAAVIARLLIVATLAVSVLIAQTGPIGFVGLIIPLAIKRIIPVQHRGLLSVTWLAGAFFLSSMDFLPRLLLTRSELPVGVTMALLGGPVFLWLIRKN